MLYSFSGFSKDNIDYYLNELGKEIRRQMGRSAKVELIIVGGASVIINYGFRNSTTDIDGYTSSVGSIKDMINSVSDKNNLPNGWLNSDFKRTRSFSPRLTEVSTYYKTFSHALVVRCVEREYLVAMKLASMRSYKNDSSDIVGIIKYYKDQKDAITKQEIINAVIKLYGSKEYISAESYDYLDGVLAADDLTKLAESIRIDEKNNKTLIMEFEQNYEEVVTSDNINEILSKLRRNSSERLDLKDIE